MAVKIHIVVLWFMTLYRETFKQIDEFTAPRFAVTNALRAAGRIQVLLMTQHA
jgi:hypothetical protein